MRLYIAAPWSHRDVARRFAASLAIDGHVITHDWWNQECGDEDHEELARLALLDWAGIVKAERLVVLNTEKSEGKAVEQGLALAYGIPIVATGRHPSNIFQNLPRYTWCSTLADLRDYLHHEDNKRESEDTTPETGPS